MPSQTELQDKPPINTLYSSLQTATVIYQHSGSDTTTRISPNTTPHGDGFRKKSMIIRVKAHLIFGLFISLFKTILVHWLSLVGKRMNSNR